MCKFSTFHQAIKDEVRIIKEARKLSKKRNENIKVDGPIPSLFASGKIIMKTENVEEMTLSFIIMQKFDLELE